jgi:hypothetical protein
MSAQLGDDLVEAEMIRGITAAGVAGGWGVATAAGAVPVPTGSAATPFGPDPSPHGLTTDVATAMTTTMAPAATGSIRRRRAPSLTGSNSTVTGSAD